MDPQDSPFKFDPPRTQPRKLILLNTLIVMSILAAAFMVVNMVVTFIGW